jgi:hypothetical protein
MLTQLKQISPVAEEQPTQASLKPTTVAIAMIKNEGDIVADWLSHLEALFDRIYIADHNSSDGTREYLLEAARNQNSLKLFSFEHPGYFQEEITNQLARIASVECPESWIFPLDADEFLALASRAELEALLARQTTDRLLEMAWKNCIPYTLARDKEFRTLDPFFIPPFESLWRKIAFYSNRFMANKWRIKQGNHVMLDTGGQILGAEQCSRLVEIRHVPFRSLAHFALKCVQGHLAFSALPDDLKYRGEGIHWTELIEKINRKGELNLDLVREFILTYGQLGLIREQGTAIYELIEKGWHCTSLSVAQSATRRPCRRAQGFLEMAQNLVDSNENLMLSRFLSIVRGYDQAMREASPENLRVPPGHSENS